MLRHYQSEVINNFDRLVARTVGNRPTPQVTIEAIMYAVRERGLGDLPGFFGPRLA